MKRSSCWARVGACLLVFGLLVSGGPAFYRGVPEDFGNVEFSLDPVTPPLDISGIYEIQSIPIGGCKGYDTRLYLPEGLGLIPAETILESIANLAVMQLDLERVTKVRDPNTGEVRDCIGGEFGRILREEILRFDGETEGGLLVEHIELEESIGMDPEGDIDKYELVINDRRIELGLNRFVGRPDKGLEWGVMYLVMKQEVEEGNPTTPTRVWELAITIEEIDGVDKIVAYYTKRILRCDGICIEGEQWKFVQGNPEPVYHIPRGPCS